ncbi:MAG: ribosome small subunit-dependent GTPase A [Chloroflexi bacterium]|nr:ribosome small subunit-dependent GTPase A [Chloroflexota bacterium]
MSEDAQTVDQPDAVPAIAVPRQQGLVVRVDGIACTVRLPDESTRRARLAGRVLRQREATAPVAIGDQVLLLPLDEQFALVDEVLPRCSELVRGEAGGGRLKQVLAANLDLLVAVFAYQQPAPSLARLDRLLLIAEQAGIAPLIVVNKCDLAPDPATATAAFALYPDLGYPVLATSAVTSQGVAALRERLVGRVSALVGASGVGKSSLLNALQPGLRLRAAAVSKSGKGRHTTTAADLLPLDGGGYLADTPGLKEIALWGVATDAVDELFPEFRPHLGACRFATCTHRQEPDCAIQDAVAAGQIDEGRYQSYLKVREEVAQGVRPPGAGRHGPPRPAAVPHRDER